MKRKLFLSLLIFFWVPVVSFTGNKDSLNGSDRVSLSVNAGIGIPIGGFNQNGTITEDNTMVGTVSKLGENINLFLKIPFKKSILGFVGKICYNSNAFDLAQYLQNNGNQTVGVGATTYWECSALAGVMISTSKRKSIIDFKLMVGSMYYCTPEIKYNEYTGNPYYAFDRISSNGFAPFAIDIGTDAKFSLGKRFFIPISIDFFYSGYSYNISLAGVQNNRNIYNEISSDWFIPVSLINITTGIGYRF